MRRNQREASIGARRDADHWHLLQIRPVVARGFQSIQRELRRNVLSGNVASPLSGPASLKQIVRKKADMCFNVIRANALQGGNRGRRQVRAKMRLGSCFWWLRR